MDTNHQTAGLREQLSMLETLFDRMPMGIAVFDRDYRLRRCNPTWKDFVEGYGPPSAKPALPGTPYEELAPGAETVAFPLFERVLLGETIKQEGLRLQTGEKVSYWDVVLAPLVDGEQVTGILNVTIDATVRVEAGKELERQRDRLEEAVARRTADLRQANEALEKERNFSSAVLDTAGALVVVVDRQGHIIRFNHAAEQTTGWSAEEVADRPFWELLLVENAVDAVQQVFRDIQKGQFPIQYENELLTKEGGRRLISWANTALLADDGSVEYVIATGIDVTDRKRAESELQERHDRLEREVDERTRQLRHRLAFENLVSVISADFIDRAPEEIDDGIREALEEVGGFMDVDRSYVFLFSSDETTMHNMHEWCAEGIEPQIDRMTDVPVEDLKWSNELLMRGEVLHIPAVNELPPEADRERRAFQAQDIRSLVAVPMTYQGRTIGLVGFDAVRERRSWADESIKLLKMLAAIFVNALERKRADAIQVGQRQFLELLATGGDFSDTLHRLVSIIEEQWPGMQALVLTLDEDGRHLHRGAAVSLPAQYVDSIEGLEIGPRVGSCGTACYRGERVIVEDIAEDPRWEGLRQLALEHGLRACWSEPVLSTEGAVIGTFAMYYQQPRSPTEAELEAIEIGSHLAGVALERKRAAEALEESERMLSTLISNLPGMAYRAHIDNEWSMAFVSEGSLELAGYRPEELTGGDAVSYRGLIHPDDRGGVRQGIQDALEAGRPFELNYRLQTRRGERWVWERGQGVYKSQGRPEALEGFVTDITERVAARQNLEQRVAERTHELSTLLDVSGTVASTLELEPLLGLVLDQLKSVVDYDAASVMVLDGDLLRLLAYRGPIPQEDALQIAFDLDDAGVNRTVVEARELVLIPDVRGDSELARAFQETAGDELDTTFGYIRSWMGVPLVVKDELVGMLALDHGEVGYYTPERAEMARAFASHAAGAMDNARLYEAEQERLEESERRRRVAEGLRDVLAVLNTDRSLTEVLETIMAHACRLLRSQAGVVYEVRLDERLIDIEVACGMPDGFQEIGPLPLIDSPANRASLNREWYAVQDLRAHLKEASPSAYPADAGLQSWADIVGGRFQSYLSIPIVVEDEVYGAMSLFYDHCQEFSQEETELGTMLADQAALAIQNARLRVEAEKSAAAAERSRLARDLHDAVTQTLFSASLIADVLPRIWERDVDQGLERLQELRELTRGALAEMRTLLLELRPAALTDADLSELLHQLAESITGRARVPVDVNIQGGCDLPVDVKVALYRIAQESLNNVAKHSGATEASVRLVCGDEVKLEIVDNGNGFDAEGTPPDSLGLGIMRERAEAIGAELRVESKMGEGTTVAVSWPG